MFKIVKDKDFAGYRIRKENRSPVPTELSGLYTTKGKANEAIKKYMVKFEKVKAEMEAENLKLKEELAAKEAEEKKAPAKRAPRKTTTKK